MIAAELSYAAARSSHGVYGSQIRLDVSPLAQKFDSHESAGHSDSSSHWRLLVEVGSAVVYCVAVLHSSSAVHSRSVVEVPSVEMKNPSPQVCHGSHLRSRPRAEFAAALAFFNGDWVEYEPPGHSFRMVDDCLWIGEDINHLAPQCGIILVQ